jgi:DNA-binding MurR/RpiR family transcriptional regulator
MPGNGLSPLEQRIVRAGRRLSTRRRRLAHAILENARETCFLSSRELARRHLVDPATIVRTAQALGYEGFGDFAADLRAHFLGTLTPYAVAQAAAGQERALPDRLRQTLGEDLERLQALQSGLAVDRVIALARQIHKARRIVIVGVDLAGTLSYFLAYALRALGFDAHAPVGSAGNLLHHVRFLSADDLVIAMSFRNCLRETVDAVRRARTLRVPTFAISDRGDGPLGRYSDAYLLVSIESSSIAGSYVAAMAALNMVIVACTHQNPRRALKALELMRDEYSSGPRWFTEAATRKLRNRPAGPSRLK